MKIWDSVYLYVGYRHIESQKFQWYTEENMIPIQIQKQFFFVILGHSKKSKKKFARHKIRSDSPDKDVFAYDLEDPGETQVNLLWTFINDVT